MPGAADGSPRNGPLTLRDVARRVGIHPATASRALNADTRHLVSATTVAKVTEAALEMGYTPNSIARSLKTARSICACAACAPRFSSATRGSPTTCAR